MLRTHYRQPIDWTVEGLEESCKIFDRLVRLSLAMQTNSSGISDADSSSACAMT